MEYGKTITLDVAFDEAVPRVKAAFKEQGFGILTEIDIKATLKEKIDAEVDPYIILGACNPQLAHRALQIEPEIGLLLPCNVVVRQSGGKVLVHALDPALMVSIPGRPELQSIADDAAARVTRERRMNDFSIRHSRSFR
ncbi:MAG: DUF302 domain-containing protein [Candidatus Dormibacteria bacterium]